MRYKPHPRSSRPHDRQSPRHRPARESGRLAREGSRSGAGWDHVAAWYDRLVGDAGSDYHRHVILPTAMRMLDPQPHERILDLCCGQGVLTRLLLERLGPPSGGDPGSHHARKRRGHERSGRHAHAGPRSPDTRTAQIVAVDASARLIAAARARGPEDPRVRWVVRDATKLGDLADGTFDAAACVMAVQDVPDTEGLFRELGRALRPGGRAVIVMMHPCFRIPRQSDWGWDEEKKTQYRRIDRYLTPLDVPIATHPGRDPGQQTFFHHRPLHVYLTALGQAGLGVTAAEEPVTHRSPPPGPRHKGQERAFAEIPIFLALRAVRLVG